MEKNTDQKINKNITDEIPITNKSPSEPLKTEQSHKTNYQTVQLRSRLNQTTQPKTTQPQTANHRAAQPQATHHQAAHHQITRTPTHHHTQPHHTHPHENTKAVLNRLSRAIGHLKSIKTMVEDGRDCSEVLIQLSAVKAAINNTGKVVLKDHLSHCLIDSIETGNMEAIEELNKAIDQFVK